MIRLVLAAAAASMLAVSTVSAAQSPPRRVVKPQSAARFSLDTPIAKLVADPRARAALARNLPTLIASPYLKQFENLSIRELSASPHASIAASKLRALEADLAKIK